MSRMLKPAAAGLAISSFCLSFAAEIPAQDAGKKKAAIQQTQAVQDPPAGAGSTSKSAPSAAKTGQQPRPPVKAMEVEKPDPVLDKVLKDWERNTGLFKKLVGEFIVIKYDPTFQIEKRARGKFAHEAPDKGSYERSEVEIPEGTSSKKRGSDGQRYEVRSDTPERWVCTGKEVIKIDDKEKTYEKIPIPPESQGENIIEGPLPFLFGMKAERAKKRYKMKLVDEPKKAENEIWLEVIPRLPGDSGNWQRAVVIIDSQRFVPTAVKLFDPAGGETVHLFSNVVVNPKRGFLDFWSTDPFAPKLRNYKQVVSGDKSSPGERLTPTANPRQSSAPSNKGSAGAEGISRSADVSDSPVPQKKAAAPARN